MTRWRVLKKAPLLSLLQFDREHFSEVFVDLKWFESKVGNKYLNEAAGLAAEKEAANKKEVSHSVHTHAHTVTFIVYMYSFSHVSL